MKVLMINSVCGIGSTGRICTDIAQELEKQGHEVKIAYGRDAYVPEQFRKYAVRIGSDFDVRMHGVKARLRDASGFGSKKATIKFISWVKEYNPDVIHLHNIHGYYINVEILFDYLKKCEKRIIWTLHDCWSFTGHCSYFEAVSCEKWQKGCSNCPQKEEYPKSKIDRSYKNWLKKKLLFSNVPNMHLVTPSEWLKRKVESSFLQEYPIRVIHNGIDLEYFKERNADYLKKKYDLSDKYVILGVASVWDKRKGLDTFIKLSKIIDDNYRIVIIGATQKQQKEFNKKIVSIDKTNDINGLVDWYNAADVFVNPTIEDNYPTTNLEAIACGTPVITFDTGGSPESAIIYGEVVEKLNLMELKKRIEKMRGTILVKRGRVLSKNEMGRMYLEYCYRETEV